MDNKFSQGNIFNIVDKNFFSILTRKDKDLNYDILVKIFNLIESQGNNRIDKQEMLVALNSEYSSFTDIEIDDEEDKPLEGKTFLEKLHLKIRQFVKTGWLNEETDRDFISYISFNDYSLEILNTLQNLVQKEKNEIEFTGYTLTIYSLLKSINDNNATAVIEQISQNKKNLERSLLGLNSRIKHYITSLLNRSDLSAEEVLDELTEKYGKKVILVVFDNLKRKDNPNKYARDIINKLEELLIEGNLNKIVLNYISVKKSNENPDEIKKYLQETILNIIEFYLKVEQIIDRIDSNNSRYVSNAKNVLQFILSDSKDVVGEINKTLKLIKRIDKRFNDNDVEIGFDSIINISPVDEESLYTPRNYRLRKDKVNFEYTPLSEEEINEAKESLKLNNEFSKENVNRYIVSLLNENYKENNKSSLKVSDMINIDNKSFIMINLAFAFSESSNIDYEIKILPDRIEVNGYSLQNLLISKRG